MNYNKITEIIDLIEGETETHGITKERVAEVLRELRGEVYERSFTVAQLNALGGDDDSEFGNGIHFKGKDFTEGALFITPELLGLPENKAPFWIAEKFEVIVIPDGVPITINGGFSRFFEIYMPYSNTNVRTDEDFRYDTRLKLASNTLDIPVSVGYTFSPTDNDRIKSVASRAPLVMQFAANDSADYLIGGGVNARVVFKMYYYVVDYPLA
jgi:hypothetical protein